MEKIMKYLLRIKNDHILRHVTSAVSRDRLKQLTRWRTPLLFAKIFNYPYKVLRLKNKKKIRYVSFYG